MTTLAPKLPYSHPFAGGYPRIGGQPLPTDPDAIDYLDRVAAADGAAVEQGVAMAVDAFVKGCKADSAGYAGDPTRTVWDALQACCIMAGARTISGALVPLVGAAPTPNNLVNFDYDRTTGIKGDGSSTYLDSNRANNADGQSDKHLAAYSTEADGTNAGIMGAFVRVPTLSATQLWADAGVVYAGINTSTGFLSGPWSGTGFVGGSHSGATLSARWDNASYSGASTVDTYFSQNLLVFARYDVSTVTSRYSGRLAFYSIGSSLDLAALDTRVTSLVQRIQLTLASGLDVSTYDDATVAYLLAGYNNGASLE